jgi:hypothetical protein
MRFHVPGICASQALNAAGEDDVGCPERVAHRLDGAITCIDGTGGAIVTTTDRIARKPLSMIAPG